MENLDLAMFGGIYAGRRVLLTGHTGFKGSWLALWLRRLGADVTGLSLPADIRPNHWGLLDLDVREYLEDIRDPEVVRKVVQEVQPEAVFHLAAQPLVRRSYGDPLLTWETNVIGTVNVLEACRSAASVRAAVIVTSDKCYENKEWVWGYREIDALGGHDPYSASKAAAELAVDSYRRAYFRESGSPLVATARAGNVIGGGDWAEDRLIPDLARSVSAGMTATIRSPHATRPWQHVLEPLCGYLTLGTALLNGRNECAASWNFGPDRSAYKTVADMLEGLQKHWPALSWRVDNDAAEGPHEAQLLQLDSEKARTALGWQPVWDVHRTLSAISEWYSEYLTSGTALTEKQLADYCRDFGANRSSGTCA